MIYEVEGDILLSRAQVVAQEAGSGDPMKRGIGKTIAASYPSLVGDFQNYCQQNQPEPGEIWLWEGRKNHNSSFDVVLMITKTSDKTGGENVESGTPGSMKRALVKALQELNRLSRIHRFESIALVKPDSGSSGMDWHEVRGLIQSQLGELLIPVYLYVGGRSGQLGYEPGRLN